MKKLNYSLLLFSILISGACNQPTPQDNNSLQNSSEAESHGAHSQQTSNALILDHGKKWMVDEATRFHIGNMEKAIEDGAAEKGDMEFFRTLSSFLEENIGKLTADCSMTGAAHDELHKWLYPFIEATKEFSAAENPETAKAALENLKTSMKEYRNFFE